MHRALYHRTTRENAELILRDKGFCTCGIHEHHRGAHGTFPGVWLSNLPLVAVPHYIAPERWALDDCGTTQIEMVIDATGAFMDQHEWKGEQKFREWLIPAPELNARITSLRKIARREAAEMWGTRVLKLLEHQRLRQDDEERASVFRSQRETLEGLVEIVRLVKLKQLVRLKTVEERIPVPVATARRKTVLAQATPNG
jgi:hypothetical protein